MLLKPQIRLSSPYFPRGLYLITELAFVHLCVTLKCLGIDSSHLFGMTEVKSATIDCPYLPFGRLLSFRPKGEILPSVNPNGLVAMQSPKGRGYTGYKLQRE